MVGGTFAAQRGLVASLGILAVVGLWGCPGNGNGGDDAGVDLCQGVSCAADQACNPTSGVCEQKVCQPACSGATPICHAESQSCRSCTATEGCSGAKPVCDTAAAGGVGACVACLTEAQCSGTTPLCAGNQCVTCTASSGCTGGTVCDTGANGGAGACVGCVGNSDCAGGTPVCNTANQTCVGCLSDAQCSGATPACDTTVTACVGCLGNAHCGGATPACLTASQTCVECLSAADCSGAAPACDTTTNSCVTCIGNADCPQGAVCDTSVQGGACVGCLGDGDCSGATPACDTTAQICVSCTGNAHCGGSTPACDTSAQTCVGCLGDNDCSGATPACNVTAQACVGCTANSHCGGEQPVCNPATSTCAGCLGDNDCSGATPACGAGNSCVGCTTNSHCSGATALCQTASSTCVGCLGDADCSGATPACGAANACVTCTNNGHCSGTPGTPICNTAATGGACVGCLSQADCQAGDQCSGNVCVPVPNTCNTAETIVFPAGSNVVTFVANTTLATDDYTAVGPCGPFGYDPGVELVYRLELTQAQDVRIDVVGATGVDPVIYLRETPCQTGNELSCSDVTGSASTETIVRQNLQAGSYFLFVENWNTTAAAPDRKGLNTVTVTLSAATFPPANDTCAAPELLNLTAGTPFTFNADTTTATDATAGTCVTTAGSRELVYEIQTTSAHDIVVTAVGATGVNPVLYLRSSVCSTGTQQGCVNATGNGGTETLSLLARPAGTYFLFVETVGAAFGAVAVTVNLNPPTIGDSCGAPIQLSVVPGVPLDFQVDTTGKSNSHVGGCYSTGTGATVGREMVYEIELAAAQDLSVSATGTGTVDGVIYLRSSPCATGTQLICRDATAGGGTEAFNLFNLQAGTYYLFIESYGSTAGVFNVTVNLAPPTLPPANDSCSSPELLAVIPGVPLSFTANTTTATDTTAGTCVSTASSAELVYQIVTTGVTDLTVSATGTTGVNPVLYLRSGGCAAGSQVACVNATGNAGTEILSAASLPAGTYFLFVETVGAAAGAVNVTVNLVAIDTSITPPVVDSILPALIANTTPTFTWTADPAAVSTTFELASDLAFTTLVASKVDTTDQFFVPSPGLASGRYFYRARSRSTLGTESANSGVKIVEIRTWEFISPRPQPNHLRGVTCVSTTRCLMVGSNGTVVLTSDGGASFQLGTSGQTGMFYQVAQVSQDVFVAVGDAGRIIRSTDGGNTWWLISSGVTGTLYDVSFDGQTGYAAGITGTVLQSLDGGQTWTKLTVPTTSSLWGVATPAPGVALAGGASGVMIRTADGGQTWSTVNSGSTTFINALTFADAMNGFAAGDSGRLTKTTDGGLTWTVVTVGHTNSMYGVSFADGLKGVTVAPITTDPIRYTIDGGATWQIATRPGTPVPRWVHLLPGTTTGYLVTEGGGILVTNDSGATWTTAPGAGLFQPSNTATDGNIRAASFVAPGVGFVFGSGGYAAKTDNGGASFTLLDVDPAVTTETVNAASFTSGTHGWVGGASSLLRRTTDGENFTAFNSATVPTPTTVNGIHFLSPSVGVAVGTASGIVRWDAGAEAFVAEPLVTSAGVTATSRTLNAVSLVSATQGFLAGASGTVAVYDEPAKRWVLEDSGNTTSTLNGIAAINGNTAVAVGASGRIVRRSGGVWTVIPSGTTVTLNAVAFADTNNGWAIGGSGVILRTSDGGLTWVGQSSPVAFILLGLSPASANEAYIVAGSRTILKTMVGGK